MDLIKTFTFDAAHKLTRLPKGHKCANLHGHTFQVDIHISGPVDSTQGWLIDFADIKQICLPVIDQLDHHYLNDIEGMENPTSENIASWIWDRVEKKLPKLIKVVVHESRDSAAAYRGEQEE